MIALQWVGGAVVTAVLLAILGNEIHAYCSWFALRIVRMAAQVLPDGERSDHLEEWTCHVAEIRDEGRHFSALVWAMFALVGAARIRVAEDRPRLIISRPSFRWRIPPSWTRRVGCGAALIIYSATPLTLEVNFPAFYAGLWGRAFDSTWRYGPHVGLLAYVAFNLWRFRRDEVRRMRRRLHALRQLEQMRSDPALLSRWLSEHPDRRVRRLVAGQSRT